MIRIKQLSFVEKRGLGGIKVADYIIGGRTLHEIFKGANGVSPFGWVSISSQIEMIDCLILHRRSPLPSRLVPLLVCEECGDLGCGAFCARVTENDGLVHWTDFASANDYETKTYSVTGPSRISFKADEYRATLLSVLENRKPI